MLIDRKSGEIRHLIFRDILDILETGDSLVLNDTKVIPARLFGLRGGGGRSEIFLVKPLGGNLWQVMARPGRKLKSGARVMFSDNFYCDILDTYADGTKKVVFSSNGDLADAFQQHGQLPLPHYMKHEATEDDLERYQTVFAAKPGALAAPTAGLHFTPELLAALARKGINKTMITLHAGLGTFKPVQVEDIRQHQMHVERFSLSEEAAKTLNNRDASHRQIVVGTTCCRTLEAAMEQGSIIPGDYETDIFIYPGHTFRYVQHLLTNFHLPGSTLLMLVAAFAGYELTMEAYRKAVEEHYRFFSYGDAMLIL